MARKGNHVVIVDDPWYGSYLRIYGSSEYTTVRPILLIGSRVHRLLRIEMIDTHGPTAMHHESVEKPLKHWYVEGSVRGDYKELLPDGTFLVPLMKEDPQHWRSGENDIPSTHWKLESTYIRKGALVTCEYGLGEYLVNDDPDKTETLIQGYGYIVVFHVTEDPVTGTMVFDRVVSVWIPPRPGISWEEIPNPFTGGNGNVGKFLPTLWDYFQREVATVLAHRGHNSDRDKSIYKAIGDISIADINWLETLPELAHPIGFLRELSKLVRFQFNIIGVIKLIANLHLFWKYVVKTGLLTWRELKELADFLLKDGLRFPPHMVLTGRGTEIAQPAGDNNVTTRHNCKICYGADTSTIDHLLDTLKMLRLVPRLVDLWDIVPYSFVVDWVIPVSDAIDNIERMHTQLRMPFLYTILSQKHESRLVRGVAFDSQRYFDIDVHIVNYEREVLNVFPSDVWLGVSFHDMTWKKWITASALFAQKL